MVSHLPAGGHASLGQLLVEEQTTGPPRVQETAPRFIEGRLRLKGHMPFDIRSLPGDHFKRHVPLTRNVKRVVVQLSAFVEAAVDREREFHRLGRLGGVVGRSRIRDDGIRADPEGNRPGKPARSDQAQAVEADTGVGRNHQPHVRSGTVRNRLDFCPQAVRSLGVLDVASRDGNKSAARAEPNGVRPFQAGPSELDLRERTPLPAQRKQGSDLRGACASNRVGRAKTKK